MGDGHHDEARGLGVHKQRLARDQFVHQLASESCQQHRRQQALAPATLLPCTGQLHARQIDEQGRIDAAQTSIGSQLGLAQQDHQGNADCGDEAEDDESRP